MATILERAAHSVKCMFSLLCLFVAEGRTLVLIVSFLVIAYA